MQAAVRHAVDSAAAPAADSPVAAADSMAAASPAAVMAGVADTGK
jgi:hypothetical protein